MGGKSYGVFGANMTIDTQAGTYSAGYNAACRSCQCQCRLCRGHRTPTEEGTLSKEETERVLEKLLAA